jgi:hypothetical protein
LLNWLNAVAVLLPSWVVLLGLGGGGGGGGGGPGSVIFLLIGKAIKNLKKEKEKMLDYLQILLTNSHNLF